ncbi:MAG: CoA pyrophosphatase [Alphaproteobacteria bacterium]|nr:MAG: CoA pyrophosphatase [Alphaproteobacteria bacterium]
MPTMHDGAPLLDRDLIFARLAARRDAASLKGDGDLNPGWRAAGGAPGRSLKRAAVLMPIVEHGHALHVLLTRRTHGLRTHAGQISFPGGRIDADDPHPVDAALREAQEEIGLPRAHVEIAGVLDPYSTATGYLITPVVGLVQPGFPLKPNPAEVAEAFEVPLGFLLDPSNRRRHSRVWQGKRRYYYAMPYHGHYIWGATAAMLVNLADILRVTD